MLILDGPVGASEPLIRTLDIFGGRQSELALHTQWFRQEFRHGSLNFFRDKRPNFLGRVAIPQIIGVFRSKHALVPLAAHRTSVFHFPLDRMSSHVSISSIK